MKTKYKYIHFIECKSQYKNFGGKTSYECLNNKSDKTLAHIFWYKPWKQYCFIQAQSEAQSEVVFNKDCLLDIVDFINKLSD